MEIYKKIKQRRKELDLTIREVAQRIGVSAATVSRWESGEIVNMRRDKIISLSKILQVSPSFFIDPENESHFHLSDKEKEIISRYRKNVYLQIAIDKLLEIE